MSKQKRTASDFESYILSLDIADKDAGWEWEDGEPMWEAATEWFDSIRKLKVDIQIAAADLRVSRAEAEDWKRRYFEA